MAAREWLGQGALYALLMALIGVFSNAPVHEALPAEASVVKVSVVHHGQRVEPCRPYTAEELSKLPPNMRAPQKCERARVPVAIEVDIDGVNVLRQTAPPAGLARDGASAIYQRLNIAAGEHRFTVRMRDAPGAAFNHTRETTLRLKPAQVLVIDFDNLKGITLT